MAEVETDLLPPAGGGISRTRPATILVTGGGSGGHVTPALAVAHAVKQLRPDVRVAYVSQTGDRFLDVPARDSSIDEVRTVRAGKFRRYHGAGWRQWLDLRTVSLNLRDGLYVLAGILQSYRLLRQLQPAAIFTRGSFVSVPVAIAAYWLHIPYVTHDSDAIPSLVNRLIGRHAVWHTVALPKEIYPYPADSTLTVGIPISRHYVPVDEAGQTAARQRLGLSVRPVILVAGGGLGAQRLNDAVVGLIPRLMSEYPQATLVIQAGQANQAAVEAAVAAAMPANQRQQVQILGYVTNLYDYSAAADVVVCRAGGTNIAELSAQAKACIVVPNAELTGGHQTKNARILDERGAADVVEEMSQPADTTQALWVALIALLADPARRRSLGEKLHQLAQPDAAYQLGVVLLDVAHLSPSSATADNKTPTS